MEHLLPKDLLYFRRIYFNEKPNLKIQPTLTRFFLNFTLTLTISFLVELVVFMLHDSKATGPDRGKPFDSLLSSASY